MCISKKRGRHSQSDVEVILSIENVPKFIKNVHRIDTRAILVGSAPPYSSLPQSFDEPCWRVADPSGEP